MQGKRKNMGFVLPVIFYALIYLSTQSSALSQSWLGSDWNYRMKVTIKNIGNPNTLIDYQVKVRLNHTNFDFTKAKPKGEDIRFAASDGTTLIDHWIEYWNAVAESALVWVKIPNVPALDSTAVYIYYGNLGATNSSNGKTTFEFFDDFESDYLAESGWSVKAPLPLVKADNATAVYNNLLYVFGGYDRDLSCAKYYLDETFAYNPVTDTWTQLADMPTARWGPVAVEFNGLIHVFAGEAITGVTGAHEVYNPATNTWSSWSNVPPQLADQGGMGIKYGNKIHLFLKQYHYEYDPATDTYTAKANVPTPRTWGTCALVNGLIYVIGGYSYGSPSGATNVNEVYDPTTDTWTTRSSMPIRKYGATRENPVIGGKIYVTHGRDGSFFINNYVYDPSTNSWSKKSSGVNPRDGVGCGVINDKLYVVGGRDIYTCAVGRNYVEEYNPANDKGEVWVISNIGVIKRDTLAKYEGRYGFFFDKTSTYGEESAQHYHDYSSCALDVYWNITNYYGTATVQPQGAILLTNNPADGCLHYFYNNGRADFSWYRSGSYSSLQAGAWNSWLPVTIIWNGSNSKAIINGTEYPVSAATINSDRIFLRANRVTREYFDLVRVRKYSSPEPGVDFGPAESSNHPPVLTLQDTAFFLCKPETTSFNLSATDPDSADILTLEKLFGLGDFTPLTGPSPLNTTHSFFPAPKDSTYLFVFRVTDAKGAFDQESSYVRIHFNQSPILSLPKDLDTLLCNLGDSIYLSVRGEDPDTSQILILEKIFSEGELLPSNPTSGKSPLLAHFLWKPDYSDTSGNPHQIIFSLKDLCGKEVQDTFLINVRFNHLPILALPADTIYNLCQVDTICFNHISAQDPDSQDSVFIQKLSDPGEYNSSSGLCCFLPSVSDSTYTFIFQARDLCGAFALDTFNLTVNLNQPPFLTLPADTFHKLCAPGDSILFEISASDPGDSLNLTKFSTEGELRPQNPITGEDSVKGIFVWKPDYPDTLSNPHLLIFEVRDNCGVSRTDTIHVRIEFNHLPVLVSQGSSYHLCDDSTICFNNLIGSDSDPDDSLSLELVSGPNCLFLTTVLSPTLINGFTCFQTTGTNTVYPFIFELKDRCGTTDIDTVYIEITPPANLLRGDPNGDASVTVSDVIYIINYLFKSGPPPTTCPKSGDVNCDSKVTVSDVVYLISYLFKGGPPPCP
jgi:N-acetylneuraminic acid mutarotase